MAQDKIIRVIVTLTPSESKRIIGKAVAKMELVTKALNEGSVVIGVGTTNSFVAEEMTGKRIDKEHFSAGIITPQGLGMTNLAGRRNPLLLRKNEVTEIKPSDLPKLCEQMGDKDVFIKGANALDHKGNAAVITVHPEGGTIGAIWNALKNRGTKLIVPVGLEKTVPVSLPDIKKKLEDTKTRIWKQMGLAPRKIYLLEGYIITEIQAFKILANVDALPIACGGVGGAEGSVTLLLEGEQENIKVAWEIANKAKGEPQVSADPVRMT